MQSNRLKDEIYNLINNNRAYRILMIICIVLSLIPLMFKEEQSALIILDKATVSIFIIDYLLRWFTAEYEVKKSSPHLRYPFTPMAIIDLLSILPSFTLINKAFKALRMFRMIRILRVMKTVRIARASRYTKSASIIWNVLVKSKDSLITVTSLAFVYILITAMIVFNVEPDTFNNFFEAMYWAAVSLTTVGYGDIYPVSIAGRLVAVISSFVGIAIVALPAGIITAGYMTEIEKSEENE